MKKLDPADKATLTVLGLVGLVLIIWNAGWLVGLGVFLLVFANNILVAAHTRQEVIDYLVKVVDAPRKEMLQKALNEIMKGD